MARKDSVTCGKEKPKQNAYFQNPHDTQHKTFQHDSSEVTFPGRNHGVPLGFVTCEPFEHLRASGCPEINYWYIYIISYSLFTLSNNKQGFWLASTVESLKNVQAESWRKAIADSLFNFLNTALKTTAVPGDFLPGAMAVLIAAGIELLDLFHKCHLCKTETKKRYNQISSIVQQVVTNYIMGAFCVIKTRHPISILESNPMSKSN